jgi:hypothetical protein
LGKLVQQAAYQLWGVKTADKHTASFTPDGIGYVGTFWFDPLSESGGAGSVAWHYSVDNADIQFLAQGRP